MKEKQTFAEKHPKINFLIGLLLLIGMVIMAVLLIKWILEIVGSWIVSVVYFVENFVNTSEQVICGGYDNRCCFYYRCSHQFNRSQNS